MTDDHRHKAEPWDMNFIKQHIPDASPGFACRFCHKTWIWNGGEGEGYGYRPTWCLHMRVDHNGECLDCDEPV